MNIRIIKAQKINKDYVKSFMIDKIDNAFIIRYNNVEVGILEFTEKDEQIYISYIGVKEEYRRNGIAKSVIGILMEKEKEIYGDALVSSLDFWLSVNADFDGEEEYIEEYKEKKSCIPFFII